MAVITLTDAAFAKVKEIRAGEPNPLQLALWIEVNGQSGGAYTYDMWFQAAADAGPAHAVQAHDDLPVVIPEASVAKMQGAVLDLDPVTGGMAIQNPNKPPASPAVGGRVGDLSGDVAQRVIQVLEQQINPAIAAHGGHAELVGVEDDAAYLRLSGGCAGCGLAAVTLSQGIEVAIFDNVPEIKRVVDVTDHASGTNPFYEAAKK